MHWRYSKVRYHSGRVSFNGRTLASQANNVGSIPITRSNLSFQTTSRHLRTRAFPSLAGILFSHSASPVNMTYQHSVGSCVGILLASMIAA